AEHHGRPRRLPARAPAPQRELDPRTLAQQTNRSPGGGGRAIAPASRAVAVEPRDLDALVAEWTEVALDLLDHPTHLSVVEVRRDATVRAFLLGRDALRALEIDADHLDFGGAAE